MGLKEKLGEDLKKSMKAGDKLRTETVRTLRAVLTEREIEKRGTGSGLTPEDEIAVLSTAAKKRRESIELFQKGGRKDLVDQESKELAIIQEYLPKQLSEQEIEQVVRRIIGETGAASAADFGKVMPAAMKELKGKADGRVIQEKVRSALGGA
jgi:uncharacterized protein YqeY